ncbi:TPA: hypothetical protein ACHYZO_005302, partial [Escherichia coli]
PWGWFGSSSKRQKRAQNVSNSLNPPKHNETLPDAKKCVRKRLSAFPCHLNVISGIRAHSIK